MKVKSCGGNNWKIVVCGSCKAQLEITQDDIYRIPDHHGGYYYSESYHARCICGHVINLYSLPKEVERETLDQTTFNRKPKTLNLRDVSDFPKKGIIFKDISPLLKSPHEFKQLVRYLAEYWEGKVDSIGGFDARGFIFASALAYEMGLPFFMLRKKGKLPGPCKEVSYNLEYGSASLEVQDDAVSRKSERVLLIDDLLATGGTALAGCKLVESVGGEIVGIQFIVELGKLNGRKVLKGYKVSSIFTC